MAYPSLPQSAPLAAAGYFVAIDQLSARNAPQVKEETVQPPPLPYADILSPLLPYASMILFVLLFIGAFGIMVMNKVRDAKHMFMAIFIALFAASIPTVLTYVNEGTRQEAKAGPEEVPRMIKVVPSTTGSIIITWETDAIRLGSVRIGKKPLMDTNARVFVGDDQQAVKHHTVTVTGLTKNQTYQFDVLSGSTWYDNGGSYIEFTYK